ncbi:hypothetical protein FCR2A7T_09190 [Flavobacterium cauense R2A-7]|nr:hypothetical protein FCR2A7T_09190 [Flavobacterium cauense R2A-7]
MSHVIFFLQKYEKCYNYSYGNNYLNKTLHKVYGLFSLCERLCVQVVKMSKYPIR